MSKNNPRIPVHLLPANKELLKGFASFEDVKGGTDYKQEVGTEANLQEIPTSTYRAPTPGSRENGNELFRRYLNGVLDLEHAKHCVLDALRRFKDKGILNTQEAAALQILFPGVAQFQGHIDPGMVAAYRAVNLKITPEESIAISVAVSAHVAEQRNWNAGRGGGSVPGRSSTLA